MTNRKRRLLMAVLGLVVLIWLIPYGIPVTESEGQPPEAVFAQSSIADVHGVFLHVRQWEAVGSEKGRILLVHGLGGSTYSWRYTVRPLSEAGFRVLAVDLPAFGYSSRQRGLDHSQRERSALLWQLLEQEDPGQNWILAGHSMGGGTVAAMAMERPQQSEGIVLVAGALFETSRGPVSRILAFPPAGRWAEVLVERLVVREERIRTSLTSAYGRTPTEEEVRAHLEPLAQPGTAGALLDLIRTAGNEPLETLKNSKVPVWAIWGEQDAWVPIDQAVRLQEEIERTELRVVEGARHCPMETHPETFNRILLDLLADRIDD